MARILLVAPDSDLAPLLAFLLEHAGHAVSTVADLAAITALGSDRPALAIVQPEGSSDGWTLCQEALRRTDCRTICLVPPGAAEPSQPGLYALATPVSPQALRTLVQTLLASRTT